MVTTPVARRFELAIPVAEWGSEKDYAHGLYVNQGQQSPVSAVVGTCVIEAVWILDSNGMYHAELPPVVSVVDPGVAAGYVRLKAQDNASLYSGLGVIPVLYQVRVYVQLERAVIFGEMLQAPDPALLGPPMWSYAGGGGGTTDHAALSNLDYASAGHTGFETPTGAQDKVDVHAGTPHPTTDEKAALAGTDGVPSATNKYVTNTDPRNSDARTPTSHQHPGTDVTSQVASAASADAAPWSGITGKPTTYPPDAHQHGAGDITSGTLDGDRLPAMSPTKLGGVPATGTPSGLFLRDDGTWQSTGGGGGGAGNILVASMAQTTDPSYVVVGIVALDPDDFPGLDIRFAIVAAVTVSGKTGALQLYDLTGGVEVGLFAINTTQPTRQASQPLALTSGVRLYEARIKSDDPTSAVVCYGAHFEMR